MLAERERKKKELNLFASSIISVSSATTIFANDPQKLAELKRTRAHG